MKARLIECAKHQRRPWYVVCVHVLKGAAAAHRLEPGSIDPAGERALAGELLCAACLLDPPRPRSGLVVPVCDLCVARLLASPGRRPVYGVMN